MFLGECPGRDEDISGEPFVGAAGQLLTRIIRAIGLSREEVYLANVIKCRPFIGSRNRTPTDSEIAACKIWLTAEIEALKPKLIVLLGATAMKSQLGMTRVSNKRGVFYSSPDEKRIYFVMYHPAAAMYDKDKQEAIKEDVLRLRAYLRRLREK
jgi:DNA polymerase